MSGIIPKYDIASNEKAKITIHSASGAWRRSFKPSMSAFTAEKTCLTRSLVAEDPFRPKAADRRLRAPARAVALLARSAPRFAPRRARTSLGGARWDRLRASALRR